MRGLRVMGVVAVVPLVVIAVVMGCGPKPAPSPPAAPIAPEREAAKDIVEVAMEAGQFENLVAAVEAAGLVETLKGPGPFTVFAPNDDAFAKLPEGAVDNLLKPENEEQLTKILTYHVVPEKLMAADVTTMTSATTVYGQDLTFKVEGDTVMVDGAKVIGADIMASNGVIHVIDSVVMPKEE